MPSQEATATLDTTPSRAVGDVANATKVGTGRSLHAMGAGRGVWARRFNEIFSGLSNRGMTEEQRQHARRCSALAIECEKMEGLQSSGVEIDSEKYKQLADACGRAFERFAVVRAAAEPAPPPHPTGLTRTQRYLQSLSMDELEGMKMLRIAQDLEKEPEPEPPPPEDEFKEERRKLDELLWGGSPMRSEGMKDVVFAMLDQVAVRDYPAALRSARKIAPMGPRSQREFYEDQWLRANAHRHTQVANWIEEQRRAREASKPEPLHSRPENTLARYLLHQMTG